MPTIMKIGSFRFHFYSDERNEPPHIHVATPDGECKFWLQPVRLARNKKSYLNRKSERIPRSLLRGMRANLKIANFLTVEDSPQLAAGNLQNQLLLMGKYNEFQDR
ncbi:MAG: DUF4160 domain-containing protein [Desulfobacterales bacterium]|nr:DUF4160 domain-containing protein [Desulfobacterales bacterium]